MMMTMMMMECCKIQPDCFGPWRAPCKLMYVAARCGHLECMKRAFENGDVHEKDVLCTQAVLSGNIECLKYAHSIGAPINNRALIMAAEEGAIEMLRFAREKGVSFGNELCNAAAGRGQVDCLRFLCEECGLVPGMETCVAAAGAGSLPALMYAHE